MQIVTEFQILQKLHINYNEFILSFLEITLLMIRNWKMFYWIYLDKRHCNVFRLRLITIIFNVHWMYVTLNGRNEIGLDYKYLLEQELIVLILVNIFRHIWINETHLLRILCSNLAVF